MKYVILHAEGMSDHPRQELAGKTPLQAACTPQLDRLAQQSELGLLTVALDNGRHGSGLTGTSILGYEPKKYYQGPGPLEAASLGVTVGEHDVVYLCTMVTLKPEGSSGPKGNASDLKKLGPKLGKRLPLVKQALATVNAAALLQQLETEKRATLPLADGPLVLEADDVHVRLQAKPGWAAAHGPSGVVVVSTDVTPELVAEGLARDFVHSVQTIRKDKDCEFTDRIAIGIDGDDEVVAAIRQFLEYVKSETLAASVTSRRKWPPDTSIGSGMLSSP